MTVPSAAELAAIETVLAEVLLAAPDGLDEYSLIQAVRQAGCSAMPTGSLLEPLTLFRAHYLLFHVLYRLRARLWQEQRAHLDIGLLRVVALPYQSAAAALATYDPLPALYADLHRLTTITAEEVQTLLAQFWSRFHAQSRRREALAVLGLCDPVAYPAIKRRYRELAMQHHPDRGGNAERLMALNAALATLDECYR